MARFITHAVLAGSLAVATPASANVEVGLTGGPHQFADNNELGILDNPRGASVVSAPLFGLRLGIALTDVFAIEAEAGVISTHDDSDPAVPVTLTAYRGQLVVQLGAASVSRRLIPFAVLGVGAMSVIATDDVTIVAKDTDFVAHGGVGVKVRIGDYLGARLDARAVMPPSSTNDGFTFEVEGLLSVYVELGRPVEAMPIWVPEPRPPVVEPEVVLDNDGDGLLDTTDECTDLAEDPDGFSDDDGCPDPDNDGDGLADGDDACRDQSEDPDGFSDDDGCPEPDNDSDGVLDGADACTDEPETVNGYLDQDGCADQIPADLVQFTGVIEGITFKTDSARLAGASTRTLDGVVEILLAYPDVVIEIQGHTDDVGDHDYNVALSQRRAEAVRDWLIAHGIDGVRLVARGFGPDVPLDPRKTKGARAKNRRVQFELITAAGAEAPAPR